MKLDEFFKNVDESSNWFKEKGINEPSIAIVLSGGIAGFVDSMRDTIGIESSDAPHFPVAMAEGHSGKLVFGRYAGHNMMAMIGRYHYYEGHDPRNIVFPYFVFASLGVKTLITTNAVGGINKTYRPGDIMMVSDHINFMGINPLIGITIQRKHDQFPSLTNAYDVGLRNVAKNVAERINLDLREGVFIATSGPSYETKAEIAAFRKLGADAVGMSTVPAVIAANFLGMKVLSLSGIANPAADLHEGKMSHDEVLASMKQISPNMISLLCGILDELPKQA